MTVRLDRLIIRLEGDCCVEDAEPLLNLIQEAPDRSVDISALAKIHTAVLQVLLAFRPAIVGSNDDEFFGQWIAPLLDVSNGERPARS